MGYFQTHSFLAILIPKTNKPTKRQPTATLKTAEDSVNVHTCPEEYAVEVLWPWSVFLIRRVENTSVPSQRQLVFVAESATSSARQLAGPPLLPPLPFWPTLGCFCQPVSCVKNKIFSFSFSFVCLFVCLFVFAFPHTYLSHPAAQLIAC